MSGWVSARNSSRNGGNSPGGSGALCAGVWGRTMSATNNRPRAAALLHLQVDRGEVFMVAVGVEAIDTQQIDPRLADGEGDTRPHLALRLEVQVPLPVGHDAALEIRQHLLAGLLRADDEIANANIFCNAMRIGI